jgi:hypothetical protein
MAIAGIIAVLICVGILYSKSVIKRDVPILVEDDNNVSENMIQANIVSYSEVCKGILYDINEDDAKYLVTIPMQSDLQTGIETGKEYMSTNLFDENTSQISIFNFDLTDHVSTCFDSVMAGAYYISSDANQHRKLMYTTIDNTKTITIASEDENISTGIVRAGSYVVYGTSDGKIKLSNIDGYKKLLYKLDDKYIIKKVRYFIGSQICIVQAENTDNEQNPLYMIDTASGDIRVIDINVEDFDANEESYSVVYISKITDNNQIYLYDISSDTRQLEKSGTLIENVFFNDQGDKIIYIERTKEEATSFNVGLVIKNGLNNIRLISDVKLANRKIILDNANTIYYSEIRSTTEENSKTVNTEYSVLKCTFSLEFDNNRSISIR